MVHYSLFPTAIGHCGIAWSSDKIIATSLPEKTVSDTARRLARRSSGTEGRPPVGVLHAIEAVTSLLEGDQTDLTFINCDLHTGDQFAAQVYAAARMIPAGETSTYGALASQLGDIGLARRVGQALGRNPLPIIVPCHRVLGAAGKLVGFSASGGVELKLRMLSIERARIGEAPSLFDDLPLSAKPQS